MAKIEIYDSARNTTTLQVPAAAIKSIKVDGVDWSVVVPADPVPEYPRPLEWDDVKKGARVLYGQGNVPVTITGVKPWKQWFGIYDDGDLTTRWTTVNGWSLLSPAPPLFEQLTPGCCVETADGKRHFVKYAGLAGHVGRWSDTLEKAHGDESIGNLFTESDLVGARIVEWPEAEG